MHVHTCCCVCKHVHAGVNAYYAGAGELIKLVLAALAAEDWESWQLAAPTKKIWC